MTWLLIITRIICTIEGLLGSNSCALLNICLFIVVKFSKNGSTSNSGYKTAILIFAMHGFTLCSFIALMNYAHVFREGTFITVVLGPLAACLPKPLSMGIIRMTMVLVTMMWTMIPSMSMLQLLTLTRKLEWSVTKRMLISFIFPSFCILIVGTTVEELIPSSAFEKIMIRISDEVYDANETLITFGSTMRYPETNIQKRLRIRGMTMSERTRRLQRDFLLMQLLQTVLPLVVLSSPFTVFLYGVFTQADLGLSALWFTSSLWICPSVQALVQLRYTRQSSKGKSLQATVVSMSATQKQQRKT